MRAALVLLSLPLLACKGDPPAPPIASSALPVVPVASAAPPPTATASAAPEPARVYPTDVPLEKLLAEYKDNEVRADGQFKGKLIRTFGTVGQVSKDLTGGIYVTVGTGAQFEHPVVQCMVSESETSAAAALSRGGKVTVQGSVGGLMMNVMIGGCVINPMAKRCERLRADLGGTCVHGQDRGDAALLSTSVSSIDLAVHLFCAGPEEKSTVQEMYDIQVSAVASGPFPRTVLGSRRNWCYGVVTAKKNDKHVPLPDEIRGKIQAFFDAL
jgi:hypothetical protein